MTISQITRDSLPDLAKSGAHKFENGHALVISGGPNKTGAARMAARGALRIGAGLVTLACPLRSIVEASTQLTAVMLTGLDGPAGLSEILEDPRINAICMGPGMGLGQITANLVKAALETKRACVLDADALSRFQQMPEALFGMLHDKVVLTPHGGEFARLFPDLAEALANEEDKLATKTAVTRVAAERSGAVVLFKGIETVVAHPDGRVAVHEACGARSVPWLATAGAGDVLAGFIAGLMARGYDPMQAACAATWLHVEVARQFGPGLIAEDLPEYLPKVLRDLIVGS